MIKGILFFFIVLFGGGIIWVSMYRGFRLMLLQMNSTAQNTTGTYAAYVSTHLGRIQTFWDVAMPWGIIAIGGAILFLYAVRRRRWDYPYATGEY